MNNKMSAPQTEALYKGYAAARSEREWTPAGSRSGIRSNVVKKLKADGLIECLPSKWSWNEPHRLTDSGLAKALELGFEARYADESAKANAAQLVRDMQQVQYRQMLGLIDSWSRWNIQISHYIGSKGTWDIKGEYMRVYGRIDRTEETLNFYMDIETCKLESDDDLDNFQHEFNRMRELLVELQGGAYKVPEE